MSDQEIKATCKVLSADFEDNTITLIMPKDFWTKYKVRRGEVELINISALVAIESEAGK